MAVNPPRPLLETDDRSSFDCGRDALNGWFQRHAWANHSAGISRINVLADAASGVMAGYVALSAFQVERAFLPKLQQRNRSDPLPVMLLSQLAVDKRYQGQGHAASLLLLALKTALRASGSVGSMGVITHPVDESARAFYAKWGFQDLPFNLKRAMIVRMIDLQKSFTKFSAS